MSSYSFGIRLRLKFIFNLSSRPEVLAGSLSLINEVNHSTRLHAYFKPLRARNKLCYRSKINTIQ